MILCISMKILFLILLLLHLAECCLFEFLRLVKIYVTMYRHIYPSSACCRYSACTKDTSNKVSVNVYSLGSVIRTILLEHSGEKFILVRISMVRLDGPTSMVQFLKKSKDKAFGPFLRCKPNVDQEE